MTQQPLTPDVAGFKDRSVGLILFGTVEILIGGLCALMAPFMLFSGMVGQAGAAAPTVRTMIPAVAFYALLAVVFIWIGVGSILARRWARALMLVLAWMWLICGIVAVVAVAVLMPPMLRQMAQQGAGGQQIPPQSLLAIQVISGGVIGCLYIILPGAFILFYQSRHVKATCELRDPQTRWTDKCPLPVLALSILLAFSAYSMIWMVFYGSVFPVFGTLISGAPGTVVLLIVMCFLGYLAWGIYELKIGAWWGAFALMILWATSSIITFSRVDLMQMYEKMGFPEEQLELMRQTGIISKTFIAWSIGIATAIWLGYLLYVRRYFVASGD